MAVIDSRVVAAPSETSNVVCTVALAARVPVAPQLAPAASSAPQVWPANVSVPPTRPVTANSDGTAIASRVPLLRVSVVSRVSPWWRMNAAGEAVNETTPGGASPSTPASSLLPPRSSLGSGA